MVSDKSGARLAASVGSASQPLRVLIASIFGAVAGISIAGGVRLSAAGAGPAAVAVLIVIPLGLVALIATLFTLAPLSRFGRGLDGFVTALSPARFAGVLALLWIVAMIIIVA